MKKLLLGVAILFLMIILYIPAMAFDVNLSWDRNTDEADKVKEYEVFWGFAPNDLTAGSVTTGKEISLLLEGFADGVWVYFAVRANGWSGHNSAFSNIVGSNGSPSGPPHDPGPCYIETIQN